jgi:hypothetical protein
VQVFERFGRSGAADRMAALASAVLLPRAGLYVLAEIQFRLDHAFPLVALQAEAELFEETLRGAVLEEHIGGDARETFDAGDLEELL